MDAAKKETMNKEQMIDQFYDEAVDLIPMYPIQRITWVRYVEAQREAYKAGRLKTIEEKDARIKELEDGLRNVIDYIATNDGWPNVLEAKQLLK